MEKLRITIPARKKKPVDGSRIIRVSEDAYNALVNIYNESTLSISQISSKLIVTAAEYVEYDKED